MSNNEEKCTPIPDKEECECTSVPVKNVCTINSDKCWNDHFNNPAEDNILPYEIPRKKPRTNNNEQLGESGTVKVPYETGEFGGGKNDTSEGQRKIPASSSSGTGSQTTNPITEKRSEGTGQGQQVIVTSEQLLINPGGNEVILNDPNQNETNLNPIGAAGAAGGGPNSSSIVNFKPLPSLESGPEGVKSKGDYASSLTPQKESKLFPLEGVGGTGSTLEVGSFPQTNGDDPEAPNSGSSRPNQDPAGASGTGGRPGTYNIYETGTGSQKYSYYSLPQEGNLHGPGANESNLVDQARNGGGGGALGNNDQTLWRNPTYDQVPAVHSSVAYIRPPSGYTSEYHSSTATFLGGTNKSNNSALNSSNRPTENEATLYWAHPEGRKLGNQDGSSTAPGISEFSRNQMPITGNNKSGAFISSGSGVTPNANGGVDGTGGGSGATSASKIPRYIGFTHGHGPGESKPYQTDQNADSTTTAMKRSISESNNPSHSPSKIQLSQAGVTIGRSGNVVKVDHNILAGNRSGTEGSTWRNINGQEEREFTAVSSVRLAPVGSGVGGQPPTSNTRQLTNRPYEREYTAVVSERPTTSSVRNKQIDKSTGMGNSGTGNKSPGKGSMSYVKEPETRNFNDPTKNPGSDYNVGRSNMELVPPGQNVNSENNKNIIGVGLKNDQSGQGKNNNKGRGESGQGPHANQGSPGSYPIRTNPQNNRFGVGPHPQGVQSSPVSTAQSNINKSAVKRETTSRKGLDDNNKNNGGRKKDGDITRTKSTASNKNKSSNNIQKGSSIAPLPSDKSPSKTGDTPGKSTAQGAGADKPFPPNNQVAPSNDCCTKCSPLDISRICGDRYITTHCGSSRYNYTGFTGSYIPYRYRYSPCYTSPYMTNPCHTIINTGYSDSTNNNADMRARCEEILKKCRDVPPTPTEAQAEVQPTPTTAPSSTKANPQQTPEPAQPPSKGEGVFCCTCGCCIYEYSCLIFLFIKEFKLFYHLLHGAALAYYIFYLAFNEKDAGRPSILTGEFDCVDFCLLYVLILLLLGVIAYVIYSLERRRMLREVGPSPNQQLPWQAKSNKKPPPPPPPPKPSVKPSQLPVPVPSSKSGGDRGGTGTGRVLTSSCCTEGRNFTYNLPSYGCYYPMYSNYLGRNNAICPRVYGCPGTTCYNRDYLYRSISRPTLTHYRERVMPLTSQKSYFSNCRSCR
ncbi:unnamed protein product [Orchesella dallaii]|uniref:Uncharacterized protein n=1 Tax=Orchesella dallaii TaxID=48710 RepID=A0ABP1PXA0_9HEXA